MFGVSGWCLEYFSGVWMILECFGCYVLIYGNNGREGGDVFGVVWVVFGWCLRCFGV